MSVSIIKPEDDFYIKTTLISGVETKVLSLKAYLTIGTRLLNSIEMAAGTVFCCCNVPQISFQYEAKEIREVIEILLKSGTPLANPRFENDATRRTARFHFPNIKPPPTPAPLMVPAANVSPITVLTEATATQTIPGVVSPTSIASIDEAASQTIPGVIIPTYHKPASATDPAIEIDKKKTIEIRPVITLKDKIKLISQWHVNTLSENFYNSIDLKKVSELLKKEGDWLLRFNRLSKQNVVHICSSGGTIKEEPIQNLTWKQTKRRYGEDRLITSAENIQRLEIVRRSMHEKARRALQVFKKLYKGISKSATAMSERYRGEALDPKHRYGSRFQTLFTAWKANDKITDSFNDWVKKVESNQKVEGITDVLVKIANEITPVKYLTEKEREEYVLRLGNDNRIISPLFPDDLTSDIVNEQPQIFVISPTDEVYVGTYKRGTFHHSSFLEAGPSKGSGELFFENGILKKVTTKSGHYWPPEHTIPVMLGYLQKVGLDFSTVQLTVVTEREPDLPFNTCLEYLTTLQRTLNSPPKDRPRTLTWTVYDVGYRDFEDFLTDGNQQTCLLRSSRNILTRDVLVFCSCNEQSNYFEVYIRQEGDGFTVQDVYPMVNEKIYYDLSLDQIIINLQVATTTKPPRNVKPSSLKYPVYQLNHTEARQMLEKDQGMSFLLRHSLRHPNMIVLARIDSKNNYLEDYLTIEMGRIVSQPSLPKPGERVSENAYDLDSYIEMLRKNKELR